MTMKLLVVAVIFSFSVVAAQDVCADVIPEGGLSCAERKLNGGCDKDFMISGGFCDITCGRCSTPTISEDCSDVVPEGGDSCAERVQFGACNKAWLVSGGYCQKTCGYCFTPEDCFDVTAPVQSGTQPSCEQRKEWGGCTTDYLINNNYCAATCGFCGAVEELEPVPIPEPVEEDTTPVEEDDEDDEEEDDFSSDLQSIMDMVSIMSTLAEDDSSDVFAPVMEDEDVDLTDIEVIAPSVE